MHFIIAASVGQEKKTIVLIKPHQSNPPFIQRDGA